MSLPRILVVEDNHADTHIIRMMLTKVLGEHIFDVLTDGHAALKFVSDHRSGTLKPEPCVLLLDLQLPKHSGLEVLEAIRLAPALDHIRVIVMSSSASPKDAQRVEELGAFYKQKPFDLREFEVLAEFIAEVCRGHLAAAS